MCFVVQSTRAQQKKNSQVPGHRLLVKYRSCASFGFGFATTRLWNEVSLSIRTFPSLEIFKKNLKNYFVDV